MYVFNIINNVCNKTHIVHDVKLCRKDHLVANFIVYAGQLMHNIFVLTHTQIWCITPNAFAIVEHLVDAVIGHCQPHKA